MSYSIETMNRTLKQALSFYEKGDVFIDVEDAPEGTEGADVVLMLWDYEANNWASKVIVAEFITRWHAEGFVRRMLDTIEFHFVERKPINLDKEV